jgi:hypothetical protein
MYLNLLHRPIGGKMKELFMLQQDYAHELNLKVTVLVPFNMMHDEEIVNLVKQYEEKYGDEIGIWFDHATCPEYEQALGRRPTQLWLYSKEEKEQVVQLVIGRFREVFHRDPVSIGAYHLDAVSMKILKKECPPIKIAVAGCFEEGVKVFHGCNNSWYLFNEGMPFTPWYPSSTNSLRPAETQEEAIDIVAVPHLSRDLALSYEGRNDFFASHPANVQRGMANEGEICPYSLNLVDQYRMQEDFNDGLSYFHVFVGATWLSGNPNIQDSDEITQKLYKELLEYFVELRSKGNLVDMYMSEFSNWFRENMPVGKPQVYLAKEMLYGSGKHYFWYADPYMRVLVDAGQGGSIGDFRPYAGKTENSTGTDSPSLAIGSYPYIIQSQYRAGIAHHHRDGARTTLLVRSGDETIDLGFSRTRVIDILTDNEGIHMKLSPAKITFKSGLYASIETIYHFMGQGKIILERKISDISDRDAELELTEYFKGCYGVTEYAEDLHGISLKVKGDIEQSMDYQYKSRTIKASNAHSVSALIPQVNTEVRLESLEECTSLGEVVEGYLFNPFFTLTLQSKIKKGKGLKTCLTIAKGK